MLQAMSITMREGFEAALVIGIMLTYLNRTGQSALKRPVLVGTLSAIVASGLVAWGLSVSHIEPDNPAVEGVLFLVAAVFVYTMVIWMWRTGGNIRRTLEEGIGRASSGSSVAAVSVGFLAFFMVAREGVEGVLFLAANVLDQGLVNTLVGAVLGLGLAGALGAAVYYGAARMDLRLFFAATSVALLLLATKFLGLGVFELAEAGVIAIPEALEEALGLLDRGVLSTTISIIIVALPLGAVVWSLARGPARRERVGS